MEISIVDMIILIICIYLLAYIMGLNSRMKGLEYTLDQISKQIDVPESPLNKEIRQLLIEGHNVRAVKRVRETLGLSLIEAKQYVDSLK